MKVSAVEETNAAARDGCLHDSMLASPEHQQASQGGVTGPAGFLMVKGMIWDESLCGWICSKVP